VVVLGLVLFGAAGALGAGVAQRLDPFGADDPATESVVADLQLQAAGYREPGVVVLVHGTSPRAPGGRERVAAIARRLRGDRDVAGVASFLSTGSRDFVSQDGRSTYLAVALGPTSDRARQDAAARIAASFAHTPGVSVGGPARGGGYTDSEAVAVGLERTGRIVTAAALLFAVAFGAFLTSKIIITKELGLGTAAAVLIDATIIRALLVPALMQLLGRWNWWAPAPLRRLHARLQLAEA
jgi:hypothetical protein